MIIAGALAGVSAVFVPPSREYGRYIDVRTLALLFSLMAVVTGLADQGLFSALAAFFIRRMGNTRRLNLALVLLCFFSSMFMTNDVALITFVPLAIAILEIAAPRQMIDTVVMQTVAANLGSMMTPFGNPQNLYLFSYYDLTLGAFGRVVLPVGLLGLALTVLLTCLQRNVSVSLSIPAAAQGFQGPRWHLAGYVALFLVCVATVLRAIPYWLTVVCVLLFLLATDRKVLRQIDYSLLLTFVFFFVFVGNVGRIEPVRRALEQALAGRELLVSALLSQVVSNVPAALMLSGFTGDYAGLLLGTNVGGLGTLIASMASLISFKLYAAGKNARVRQYLLVFFAVNICLLAVMLAAAYRFAR